MDQLERRAAVLLAGCRFRAGSYDKRFARDMGAIAEEQPARPLTEKQRQLLWKQVVRYRRQLPADLVEIARSDGMSEAEWLNSIYVARMIKYLCPTGLGALYPLVSNRKLRLLAQHLLAPLHVEPTGEGYPDDPYSWLMDWLHAPAQHGFRDVAYVLREIVGNPFRPITVCGERDAMPGPKRAFGCAPCTQILTPNVYAIATAADTEQQFELLPILADALEDAGCAHELLLRHLRGQELCWDHEVCLGVECANCDQHGWAPLRGPHVRGCWALDLILGKE